MTEYKLDGTRWRSAYKRDGSRCVRETPATLDEAGETLLTSAKATIAKYDPDGTALKFAFITDLHRSESGLYTTNAIDDRYSLRLLSRLCDEIDLDAVFCGGDIVNGRDENASYVQKNMQDVVDDFDSLFPYTNVFATIGNHDKRYSTSRETNTNEFLHDLWDQVQYDGNGCELHYIDATNFYVDFTKHKARMIFVNQYDGVDSNSSWYANEFAKDATGLTTHGSTSWHSALPTTDKSDWLVGVVYHGADTGEAGNSDIRDFKFSDLKDTLQAYVDGGGRGILGAFAGHYHVEKSKTILPSLNVVHVNAALAMTNQLETSDAYCFSVFVVDSETGLFHEVRIGRKANVVPFRAFLTGNNNNGLLQNGTFSVNNGYAEMACVYDGNHVRFDNYWNITAAGINFTNLSKNWGNKGGNFVTSDTANVLFSAKAGDVIKTEIIFSHDTDLQKVVNDEHSKSFKIFSPQIADMVTGTAGADRTFEKEITLAEDTDVTAIGLYFDAYGWGGPLDFTLNIYKNGVKLVRSDA